MNFADPNGTQEAFSNWFTQKCKPRLLNKNISAERVLDDRVNLLWVEFCSL